jgi:hypothetical protein
MKLTWKSVTEEIKAHGGVCRSTVDGEHVVKIAGGVYFTDSPIDALGTAKAMYESLGYNWETGEKTK